MAISRALKLATIQTSFAHMMKQGWFSTCEVDKAAKLLGVSISSEQKSFFGLLHCVKFGDMPNEVKDELQRMLEEVFSQEAFTVVVGKTLLGKPKTKHLRIATQPG